MWVFFIFFDFFEFCKVLRLSGCTYEEGTDVDSLIFLAIQFVNSRNIFQRSDLFNKQEDS